MSHKPPSSTSFLASGPVPAGHLLRGNTGLSIGEQQRHLGPIAGIDGRTSTETDEKIGEDRFSVFQFFILSDCVSHHYIFPRTLTCYSYSHPLAVYSSTFKEL